MNTDKTRLSITCCLVGGVNWVRNSCSFQYIGNRTVLSCLQCERICELVLTQFPNDVTIGNHAANWKLGQDKTRLSSHRISRLDKTVSKFSLTDSLVLSPIQFTPRTPTKQDKAVLSCWCRRCELAIRTTLNTCDLHLWTQSHDLQNTNSSCPNYKYLC